MTERLYYTDSYTTQFEAQIVARTDYAGRPALLLDRSYFYPASGGQPPDTGTINAVAVLDVVIREDDGAVLHVMAADVSGDATNCVINWPRRFDHMQHHSGQHILTQAFQRAAGAETVSFHLGAESVTIDLDRAALTETQITAAEDLANAVVTRDVAVRAWFPTQDEIAALPLRKVPDVAGKLRVVAIGDFDHTACGGTHVARSGEVGLIKVLRAERRGETLRVEFCCGGRALADYREKNAILLNLSADLTTGYREIGAALAKLRDENKALQKDLKAARAHLLRAEARELWEAAPLHGELRIVRGVYDDRDAGEVRQLASHLVERAATVALLGLAGPKANLVLARSAALDGPDMAALLREALGALMGEAGRGGGRPDFAQGGGGAADAERLAAALAAIEGAIVAPVEGE